jgi:hypothetical protein
MSARKEFVFSGDCDPDRKAQAVSLWLAEHSEVGPDSIVREVETYVQQMLEMIRQLGGPTSQFQANRCFKSSKVTLTLVFAYPEQKIGFFAFLRSKLTDRKGER